MYQILQKFDIHWHDGGPSIAMMYHLKRVSDLLCNWKSCLLCYMKDVVLHCSIFFKWNKLVRVRVRVRVRVHKSRTDIHYCDVKWPPWRLESMVNQVFERKSPYHHNERKGGKKQTKQWTMWHLTTDPQNHHKPNILDYRPTSCCNYEKPHWNIGISTGDLKPTGSVKFVKEYDTDVTIIIKCLANTSKTHIVSLVCRAS